MDLQQKIVDGTIAVVTRRNPLRMTVNAVVYAAIGAMLVYAVYPESFDVTSVVVCVAFGALYTVLRDYLVRRQARAVLASHVAYVKARHPQVDLYVPMLDKVGSAVLLKRSGLFLEDGELALEAFNQPPFAKVPKDSITVPCGVDFRIFEATDDAKLPIRGYRAELMKNPYAFFVLRDEEIAARITSFAAPIERTE